MIKNIVQYPTPPSVEYSTDIRVFDDSLQELITDLKDTITANDLQGLAAYQIGNQHNVIVVKDENGEFLELINPRIINPKGSIETEETTAYFPGLSAKVKRHETVSIVYQDNKGETHSLQASGEFAILLQRKIDFTFGSSFINKLSKDEKKRFEKKLEFGSNVAIPESCPVFSYKDQINKVLKVIFVGMFLILISLFFQEDQTQENFLEYQQYLGAILFIGTIIYTVVGYIEGKRYSSCTSCQIGNIIGIVLIHWLKLFLISIATLIVIHYF
jgi:peptide deformylase